MSCRCPSITDSRCDTAVPGGQVPSSDAPSPSKASPDQRPDAARTTERIETCQNQASAGSCRTRCGLRNHRTRRPSATRSSARSPPAWPTRVPSGARRKIARFGPLHTVAASKAAGHCHASRELTTAHASRRSSRTPPRTRSDPTARPECPGRLGTRHLARPRSALCSAHPYLPP